jgi:branched-chain amino acid transport system substrate-binding protein
MLCSHFSARTLSAEPLPALRVGAILPLSGPAANVGYAIRGGIEIALEHLAPDVRSRFQVSWEDDGNVPRNSIAAFRKFAASRVDVMISATAQPSMVLAPLSDQEEIPLIAIAVPAKIVSGRKWTVLFFSTPERMAKLMLDEAERRGYRRVARINSIHDGREAQAREFDNARRGRGLEVVLDEEYPLHERDFRTYVSKLRLERNVDAVYANLFLGQIGLFARQLREAAVTMPIFTSDTFIEDLGEQQAANGALRNQWYVSEDEPQPWFAKEYKKRFPNQTAFCSANGHDVIVLLAQALQQGFSSRKALNSFLHNAKNLRGVLGTFSSTGDSRFDLPVAVKMVTADGVVVLRRGE